MDGAAAGRVRRRRRIPPVDPAEYLHVREAVARVDRGEAYADVAEDTGLPDSTLRSLVEDRRDLYLAGEAEDDRVDAALADIRPVEDLREDRADGLAELRERVARLEDALEE
ncbi:hypothetical protein [Halorubrum sp. Atlit-26R]|uniref:hypothetical protein n=1 Tax=Halorubrum sp. Atlit-26R TaxID=2282128 RepID=UPI001F43305F|nr:hypothetical protein [Halorubrum sp. Atlit-26R]